MACSLLPGTIGVAVQGILFLVTCGILVLKKLSEGKDRTWMEFILDSSKQAIGAGWVHVLNIVCGTILGDTLSGDPCDWYWINIMVDTTLGVFIEYFCLNVLTVLAELATGKTGDFITGHYESTQGEIDRNKYFKQLGLWLLCICFMKAIILLLVIHFQKEFLAGAGFFLGAVNWNPLFKLLAVMVITPCCMNTLQFWLTDNFIKTGGVPFSVFARSCGTHASACFKWLRSRRSRAPSDGEYSDMEDSCMDDAPHKVDAPSLMEHRKPLLEDDQYFTECDETRQLSCLMQQLVEEQQARQEACLTVEELKRSRDQDRWSADRAVDDQRRAAEDAKKTCDRLTGELQKEIKQKQELQRSHEGTIATLKEHIAVLTERLAEREQMEACMNEANEVAQLLPAQLEDIVRRQLAEQASAAERAAERAAEIAAERALAIKAIPDEDSAQDGGQQDQRSEVKTQKDVGSSPDSAAPMPRQVHKQKPEALPPPSTTKRAPATASAAFAARGAPSTTPATAPPFAMRGCSIPQKISALEEKLKGLHFSEGENIWREFESRTAIANTCSKETFRSNGMQEGSTHSSRLNRGPTIPPRECRDVRRY